MNSPTKDEYVRAVERMARDAFDAFPGSIKSQEARVTADVNASTWLADHPRLILEFSETRIKRNRMQADAETGTVSVWGLAFETMLADVKARLLTLRTEPGINRVLQERAEAIAEVRKQVADAARVRLGIEQRLRTRQAALENILNAAAEPRAGKRR